LIDLGAYEIGGFSAAELRATAGGTDSDDPLLVTHPDRAPASKLASSIEHEGKHGFVVADKLCGPDGELKCTIVDRLGAVNASRQTVATRRVRHLPAWRAVAADSRANPGSGRSGRLIVEAGLPS
jgi:hypothetical protein